MLTNSPADWSRKLTALARSGLGDDAPFWTPGTETDRLAYIDAFRDDFGHRRRVDRPLLGHLLGVRPDRPAPRPRAEDSRAEHLWWALLEGADPEPFVHPVAESGIGPVTPPEDELAIEIWTEDELAALHALSHHADRAEGTDLGERLRARVRVAAAWHVERLQPDNGTNHPWAVHVFLRLGGESADARLHAETLVHNACVATGRPDTFSACLLLDAGRSLG